MKRNQCIICFERIANRKDKISTSHNTLKTSVIHSGWYHINCLKAYIEYGENGNIPRCPLCRDKLIIDIPGYKYTTNELSFNVASEMVRDETIENVSNRVIVLTEHLPGTWIILTGPNLLLLLQFMIRYGIDAYLCFYFYTLYSSMLIAYSKYRNNQQYNRILLNSWVNINKLIFTLLWFEVFISSTQYIVNTIVYDMGYYEKDYTIEYEII
jgi:hypothetical protein